MSPRIKAFLIHLAISLCILAVLLVIIYKIWFPQPFFSGDGGWQGMRLVAGVDLILGPLLTLIVFNIKKPWKELRRDLSIIGLIQITALSAGVWQVYQQRTSLIVFADGYFVSLSGYQVNQANPPPDILKEIMSEKPRIAYVGLPDDPVEAKNLLIKHVMGEALHTMGERFESLTSENQQAILSSGHELWLVADVLKDKKTAINAFLEKHQAHSNSYIVIPINLRYKELSLVLDKLSGEIIGTLPITLLELKPVYKVEAAHAS